MAACHVRRHNWLRKQWGTPASLPVSQSFGYWFWLLVPEQIIGGFGFLGIHLHQLCQLMVSCILGGQAAGSLCLCHFCAESRLFTPWQMDAAGVTSLSSQDQTCWGKASRLLRDRGLMQQALHRHHSAASFYSCTHHQNSHRFQGNRLQNGPASNPFWNTAHIFPLIKGIL